MANTPFNTAEYQKLRHYFLEEQLNYPRGTRLPSRAAAKKQRGRGTRFDRLDDEVWGRIKAAVTEAMERGDEARACVLLRQIRSYLADPVR